MKKPTYAQLVALVEYLSVPAEYENLPLLDAPKAAIEYCIKNRKSHIFSDSTEFDAEQESDSVVDDNAAVVICYVVVIIDAVVIAVTGVVVIDMIAVTVVV